VGYTYGVGYGGVSGEYDIAIDGAGDVWGPNYYGNSVSEFSNSGVPISPSASNTGGVLSDGGYTGGGLNGPIGVAIDGSGNVWVANGSNYLFINGIFVVSNTVTELSNSGVAISPPAVSNSGPSRFSPGGFSGGGLTSPGAIAIDSSGSVWITNGSYTNSSGATLNSNSVSELSGSGVALSPASGFTGGGLNGPAGIAIDGRGNVWVANYKGGSISEFSNSGVAISPSTGFTGGAGLSQPYSIAIDGSGDVWTGNDQINGDNASVTEFIGAAVPVVTPIAAGVANDTLGTRP
jgi:hypothetical protein